MAERCVVCGKKYKRSVTAAHLKSHRISKKRYTAKQEQLTEAQWNFYWKNEKIRAAYPDPVGEIDEPIKGFSTYGDWVRDRHPELSE